MQIDSEEKKEQNMKEYRKEVLTVKDIAYMMDPSVFKLDTSYEDVYALV